MCFLPVFILRFALSLSIFCLYFNLGNFGLSIFVTQFLFGAVEIPANLLCFWLLEVFGRKILFVATLLAGGLSCLLVLAVPRGKPLGTFYQNDNLMFLSCLLICQLLFLYVFLFFFQDMPLLLRPWSLQDVFSWSGVSLYVMFLFKSCFQHLLGRCSQALFANFTNLGETAL